MAAATGDPKCVDLFFDATVDSYVSNSRFLRRDWLAAEVMDHLRDPDCRFVLLTGEPGTGKSTFAAQLAHDHPQWPVYFIRRDQRTPLGDAGARSFLLRIGYQLTAHYPRLFTKERITVTIEQRIGAVSATGKVVGAEVERILASPFYEKAILVQQRVKQVEGEVVGISIGELVIEPRRLPLADLQYMALIDPALAMLESHPDEQIVVLIDALDELRYHDSQQNVLEWLTNNCPQLPSNVRFILTSRPPDDALLTFCEKRQPYLQRLVLRAEDAHVQADLRTYVEQLVAREEFAAVLEEAKLEIDEFVATAIEKADGNIGYLDAVARGIDQALANKNEQAVCELLTLKELPDHIKGLYAFFLRQIKTAVNKQRVEMEDPESGEPYDKPTWSAVYKPILGVLAVALEPMTLMQIRNLGRIRTDSSYVTDAIDGLHQFLDLVDGRCYRLYHTTLPEFLTDPRTQEQADTAAFYVDSASWHKRIAGYYIRNYAERWLECDDYGLLHLAAHLHALRDEKEHRQQLYKLIDRSFRDSKLMRLGNERSFLTDLGLIVDAAKQDDVIAGVTQMARAGFTYAFLGELIGDRHEVYRALSLLGGVASVDTETISDPVAAARVLLEAAERLAQQEGCVDDEVLRLLDEALERAKETSDHYQETTLRREVACLQAQARLDLAIATVNPTGYGVSHNLVIVLREGARCHPMEALEVVRRETSLDYRDVPTVYAAIVGGLVEMKAPPEEIKAVAQEGLDKTAEIATSFKVLGLSEIARALHPLDSAESLDLLRQAEDLCTEPTHVDDHALRFLALAWGRINWSEAERLASLIEDPPIATQTWAELARLMCDTDVAQTKAAYEEAQRWALQIDPRYRNTQRKNWIRSIAMEVAQLEGRGVIDLAIEDMWGEGRRHGDLTVMLETFARTLVEALPGDDDEAHRYTVEVINRVPEQYSQERLQVLGNAVAFLSQSRPRLAMNLLSEALHIQTEQLRDMVRQKLGEIENIVQDPDVWHGWPGYWEQGLACLGDSAWRWMDATTFQAQARAARNLEEMEAMITHLEETSGQEGAARQLACQLLGGAYGYQLEECDMPGLISDAEVRSCLIAGIIAHLLPTEPDRAIEMAQNLPRTTSGRVESLARVAVYEFKRDPAHAQWILGEAQKALQSVDAFLLYKRAASHLVRHWATVDPSAARQLAGLQPDEWEPDIPEDDYAFSSRITVEEIVLAMSDVDLEEAIDTARVYPQFFERYLAVIACRINERGLNKVAKVIALMTDPSLLGQLAARFIATNPTAALEAWGRTYALEFDAFFEALRSFVAFLPGEQSSIGDGLLARLKEDQIFLMNAERPLVDRLKQIMA